MNDQEILDLVSDLKDIGPIGPMSRFGSDLDDVVEAPGRYRNGAKAFLDPRTGARYISHANGYVRRYVGKPRWGNLVSGYCLNLRKKKDKIVVDSRVYPSGVFIMLQNEEDRLSLIARGIRNYRKTRGSYI